MLIRDLFPRARPSTTALASNLERRPRCRQLIDLLKRKQESCAVVGSEKMMKNGILFSFFFPPEYLTYFRRGCCYSDPEEARLIVTLISILFVAVFLVNEGKFQLVRDLTTGYFGTSRALLAM